MWGHREPYFLPDAPHIKPERPLSVFDGTPVAGTWTLTVADAENLFKEALEEAEKSKSENSQLALGIYMFAQLYHAQSKYTEAEQLLKRSLEILEKTEGTEHIDVATTLETYADLLRKMERKDEAEKMESRARAIRTKHAQKLDEMKRQ